MNILKEQEKYWKENGILTERKRIALNMKKQGFNDKILLKYLNIYIDENKMGQNIEDEKGRYNNLRQIVMNLSMHKLSRENLSVRYIRGKVTFLIQELRDAQGIGENADILTEWERPTLNMRKQGFNDEILLKYSNIHICGNKINQNIEDERERYNNLRQIVMNSSIQKLPQKTPPVQYIRDKVTFLIQELRNLKKLVEMQVY